MQTPSPTHIVSVLATILALWASNALCADDKPIIVDGRPFAGSEDLAASDYFKNLGLRCGTPDRDELESRHGKQLRLSDCSLSFTNPSVDYDPDTLLEIPVWVHILMNDAGTQGVISDAMVHSQIEILNEDFQALAGTPGAPGSFTGIRFVLADEDENGTPASGITRSHNTTWFNDNGTYYSTLAQDPNRFVNIYKNTAGGYLGYVPDLPQGGLVGSDADRVVIHWESFGRNSAYSPFDQGRTATHEVGHYLGLFHTFEGGCAAASAPDCYSSGDTVCDTASESSPNFGGSTIGCPGNSSCSSADPVHNYMDYSDDICMWEFTMEQLRRMRCSLELYRPSLYREVPLGSVFLDGFEGGDTTEWSTAVGGV